MDANCLLTGVVENGKGKRLMITLTLPESARAEFYGITTIAIDVDAVLGDDGKPDVRYTRSYDMSHVYG